MMIHSANIATTRAERTLKALCNHFARKTTAGYEGDKGFIDFGDGRCELVATPEALLLQVEAANAGSLARVERVVADHLLRFTPEEEIQIQWHESMDNA